MTTTLTILGCGSSGGFRALVAIGVCAIRLIPGTAGCAVQSCWKKLKELV